MTKDDVIRAWKECKFYGFANIGNSGMSLYTVEAMKKNKVWYECIEHNLKQPINDDDVYLIKPLWIVFPNYVESFSTLLKWLMPHFDLSNKEKKTKEYKFKSMDELKKFLEERKNEKRELFYYGDLDNLDGELYTIEDIEKDMDPSWFENSGVSTVYEFEVGEIEEEEDNEEDEE